MKIAGLAAGLCELQISEIVIYHQDMKAQRQ
jgi:hypothetical protein